MRIRKSGDKRRDEIIETTLDLAYRLGPDRITTEAIARAVGLTHGAIFRHFPSKADIWLAVVEWLCGTLTVRWSEASAIPGSPVDRARAVLRSQFAFIERVPAVPAVLLSRELQAGDPAVRSALAAVMDKFRATLAGLITEARGEGQLGASLDPDRTAFMLIALIQGTALRWLLTDSAFDLVTEGMALVDCALAGLYSQGVPTEA